jgi:hypothetical protein
MLVVLLGLFGLGVIGVVGTGAYVMHRARRAGVDPDLFRSNPGLAIGRLVAAAHPDLELLDANEGAGTLMLRDRRTGKRFTMSFDDARHGRFTLRAADDEGHGGTLELGGNAKLPSWIPQYPGSNPTPVFSARGESEDAAGEAGSFTFDTDDSPERVLEFYQDKARESNMSVRATRVGDATTLTANDEDRERGLKVIAVTQDGRTRVNVTYGRKR